MWVSFRAKNFSVCSVVAGVLELENEQDRDAIRKAKVLYSSCMNESKALITQSKHESPILLLKESFLSYERISISRAPVKYKI